MMGLSRSAAGVRIGAGISSGGEYMVLGVGDEDVEDDESELCPRMRDINVAAVWRRLAKLVKDLKIASWTSRFGSLCNLLLLEVLIGAALAQQNMGSEYDMFVDGGFGSGSGGLTMPEKEFWNCKEGFI